MAVSYPRTDLHTLVKFADCQFELLARVETSRTAGGVTRAKELGPQLWRATFQTVPLAYAAGAKFSAWLASLDGGVRTFEAHDVLHPFPAADPAGATLGASAVAIKAVTGGALSLKGLPAGYVLTAGDYLAFDTAGGLRALHQVMETVTADGSGETAAFEVRPHVRAGAAADDVVDLTRPAGRFTLDPGSVSRSLVQGGALAFGFVGVQVLS